MQVHDENVASQVKVPQYTLISSYKTQGVPTTGFFQLLWYNTTLFPIWTKHSRSFQTLSVEHRLFKPSLKSKLRLPRYGQWQHALLRKKIQLKTFSERSMSSLHVCYCYGWRLLLNVYLLNFVVSLLTLQTVCPLVQSLLQHYLVGSDLLHWCLDHLCTLAVNQEILHLQYNNKWWRYIQILRCKSVFTAAVLAQSVERVDCRAGSRGFDSWGRTNTQGLKITEKWRYSLCTATG